MPQILATGLVCLDIIKQPNSTQYLSGGSCCNVVSALSFLGWESKVITSHFSDEAGSIINENFKQIGVKQLETRHHSPTPRIVEQLYDANGNRNHQFLLVCPQCGSKLPKAKQIDVRDAMEIPRNFITANVFYSDRSSAGIRFLKDVLSKDGSWIVYEPNTARNLSTFINEALTSHIVKFSGEKVGLSTSELLRSKATTGVTILIIRTLGKDGLVFTYRNKNNKMSDWIHIDAQPTIELVDSAGAGDWCTAGLLFNLIANNKKNRSWLTKDEVVAALQFGQALSAISCAFVGAQGLLYANAIEKLRTVLTKPNLLINRELEPVKPTIMAAGLCNTCLLPN